MDNKYINQVVAKLGAIEQAGAFHEDTVLALFALIRQHLEANGLKQKYWITNFYCNWCLHTSLDRSPAREFLQEISEVVADEKETLLNDRINEIISIPRLRKELVEIVTSVGVSSSLFSKYTGWQAFLRVFLKSLLVKPIQRMDQLVIGKFVQQLILGIPDLSTIGEDYLDQNSIPEGTVFWKVLILPKGYYTADVSSIG